MKFGTFLTLTLIAGLSLSEIGPGKGVFSPTLLQEDSYSESVNMMFDYSKSKPPFTFQTSEGRFLGAHNPTQTRKFDAYGVKQLDFISQITDTLSAFVYDGAKVVFQFMDHNGKAMLRNIFYDFSRFGTNSRCTAFVMNSERGYIYVGCHAPGMESTLVASIFPLIVWVKKML